jgi:hypothetical protein
LISANSSFNFGKHMHYGIISQRTSLLPGCYWSSCTKPRRKITISYKVLNLPQLWFLDLFRLIVIWILSYWYTFVQSDCDI